MTTDRIEEQILAENNLGATNLRRLAKSSEASLTAEAQKQATENVTRIVRTALQYAISQAKLGLTQTTFNCDLPSTKGDRINAHVMIREIVASLRKRKIRVNATVGFPPFGGLSKKFLYIEMDWSEETASAETTSTEETAL